MSDDSLKYNIAITLIKGIGPLLAKQLIAYTGSAEAVFQEKKVNLERIPGIGELLSTEILKKQVLARAEEEIAFITKNKIFNYFYTDREYPYRLKECPDSPLMIYTKGNSVLNSGKFIGIVGTRNATDQGKENCRKLIENISQMLPEAVIVSGLAYGIDICAHKAALDNGLATLGVIGHGLDRIYPSAHRSIAVRMLEKGGLVTEYMSNTNPDRQNFVQRNRIIAGMCDATIVVESGIKGGALITAEIANDYNRDVFAFPGRVSDEWSAGCNALIKNNKAFLIESATDLIQMMGWEKQYGHQQAVQTVLFPDLSDEDQLLIQTLRSFDDGAQLNELSLQLNLPVSKVSSQLLTLEFKGLVKCFPGNRYQAVK